MVGNVGIDPSIFWTSTLRQNALRRQAFEYKELTQWERTRQLEFRVLDSIITMNGKKAFKYKRASELYPLASDKHKTQKVTVDKERTIKAVERFKKRLENGK